MLAPLLIFVLCITSAHSCITYGDYRSDPCCSGAVKRPELSECSVAFDYEYRDFFFFLFYDETQYVYNKASLASAIRDERVFGFSVYYELPQRAQNSDFGLNLAGVMAGSKRRWERVLNAVIRSPIHFQGLDLAHNDLGFVDESILQMVIKAIEAQTDLVALDLSHNKLRGERQLHRIVRAAGSKVTRLNITNNELWMEPLSYYCGSTLGVFRDIRAPITILDMSSNILDETDILWILRGATIPLKELDVWNNLVDNTGDEYLAVVRPLQFPFDIWPQILELYESARFLVFGTKARRQPTGLPLDYKANRYCKQQDVLGLRLR